MAQFTGFKCDSCGNVIDADQRHKVTTRYEGPDVQGEFSEDRCRDCTVVPEHVTLKPLRRRRAARPSAPAQAVG